jgi:broad specificity phosphatase PhoE
MATVSFITHPDVVIDPAIPVPDWPLSDRGRKRLGELLRQPWVASIGAIWCSTERKAREAAAILAEARALPVTERHDLGENDRSATGYLPRSEFEAVADAFFASPATSVRGWERAVDAQRRIVGAVNALLAETPAECDVAVVSHGAVGALLMCHLGGMPISRLADQPADGGGNFFRFDRATGRLLAGWLPIDAAAPSAPGRAL